MKNILRKSVLLVVLACIFSGFLFSQNEFVESESEEPVREKIAFKIPIFSIFDFTSPSINFAIENRVSNKLGIHQEVGYINSYFNALYQTAYLRNTHGIKYWIEPRFYLKPKENSYLFITPSVYYKYYLSNHSEEMLRYGGQYIQMMDYSRFHHQLSLIFKVGNSYRVGNSENVYIDMSGGIGFKYLWISSDLPSDADFFQFVMIAPRPTGFYARPVAFFGMAFRFGAKSKN